VACGWGARLSGAGRGPIVGKADLPIRCGVQRTAAVVLVVSFVALDPVEEPAAAGQHRRRSCDCPGLDWLAGLIGVGLFALVVYSGSRGPGDW
jgi:hypothetical protein